MPPPLDPAGHPAAIQSRFNQDINQDVTWQKSHHPGRTSIVAMMALYLQSQRRSAIGLLD